MDQLPLGMRLPGQDVNTVGKISESRNGLTEFLEALRSGNHGSISSRQQRAVACLRIQAEKPIHASLRRTYELGENVLELGDRPVADLKGPRITKVALKLVIERADPELVWHLPHGATARPKNAADRGQRLTDLSLGKM